MVMLFDILHSTWCCASNFTVYSYKVLTNVGHHLTIWSLYKITFIVVSVSIVFTIVTETLKY